MQKYASKYFAITYNLDPWDWLESSTQCYFLKVVMLHTKAGIKHRTPCWLYSAFYTPSSPVWRQKVNRFFLFMEVAMLHIK